jgi:hypothetical protein
VSAPDSHGVQVGHGNRQVNVNVAGDYLAAARPSGVEWPVVVGRPPRQADAFQDRPGLRAKIWSGLAADQVTVLTQVVTGDGGTGKSQLAGAAFRAALAGGDGEAGVAVAVWVTAATRAAVLTAYAQAYTRTHPALGGAGEAEDLAGQFLAWLQHTPRRWLVVLDDLADPADLDGLWPAGPAGRVLVTTRRRDAALPGRRSVIDIGVFTSAEATAYLTEKLSPAPGAPRDVLDGAAALAQALGYLPLALCHAAAVIINDAISCATYTELLADRARRLGQIFPTRPTDAGDEYAHTVAGTWAIARDRANNLDPAGLAAPMLNLISVLDPNGIPETVLTSHRARTYLQARHTASGTPTRGHASLLSPDSAAARRAVRNLYRLSLINHDPDDKYRSVRMHALAQRATTNELDHTTTTNTIRAAADALRDAWPDIETDATLGQVLRANAAVLADRNPTALWEPDAHPVLFRHGRSLGEAGLVTAATTHFTALTTRATRTLGPDHPDTLTTRHSLAEWQGRAGDLAGAAAATQELLADQLRVLGPDHPHTLTTRGNLARWRGEAGDVAGAAAAFEQLLADQLRVLGPDHQDTLSTRHQLARWRGQAGDAARAAAALEQLLADCLRVLGPDHPDTLTTRHAFAYWRGQAGDPAAAAAAFEHLLADHLRVLGPNHPDTLTTRLNLARWRGQVGDASGAVAALEDLLADDLRVLGPDHPNTLTTRQNLAYWRGQKGDAAGTAIAFEQLLADYRRVLGPDHPGTLITWGDLAYWRGRAGDPAGAVAALEELLTTAVRVLDPDHPITLTTRHELAYWRGEAGDPAGAAAAFEQLLADHLRVLGPNHPDTLKTQHNLAYWRAQADDAAAPGV